MGGRRPSEGWKEGGRGLISQVPLMDQFDELVAMNIKGKRKREREIQIYKKYKCKRERER